jgi:hypothetical protein
MALQTFSVRVQLPKKLENVNTEFLAETAESSRLEAGRLQASTKETGLTGLPWRDRM